MPRRGYRKGISDAKVPLGRRIHTRLPESVHTALMADAEARSLDAAKILRELATAFYIARRVELPQARGKASELVRAIDRLGNNLNQIARAGNMMKLHLVETEARALIAKLDRLASQFMR